MIRIDENVDFKGGNAIASGSIVEASQIVASRGFTDTSRAIVAVDTGAKTFEVAGDHIEKYKDGGLFVIAGSTGNDKAYTINGDSTFDTNTEIIVNETVPDATVDGTIDHAEVQWRLSAVALWWKSLVYCNANAAGNGEDLQIPAAVEALPTSFDITESEANDSGLIDLWDTDYKAQLDTVYDTGNVVIV